MSDLTNAEVYARWSELQCSQKAKQTALDYWYDFLVSRANRCDSDDARDAKRLVGLMDSIVNK